MKPDYTEFLNILKRHSRADDDYPIIAGTKLHQDLKMDELGLIETVMDLEAVFDIEFPDDVLDRLEKLQVNTLYTELVKLCLTQK